ncbi:hypothetical protein SRIMM317S_02550 [Streptomyces rimosus subsp. rimosus]
MVSSPAPTSADAPSAASAAEPLRPISSSLYGSPASSARASSSLTGRRANFCPRFWISCIFFSMRLRSSGVNGVSTSKS